MQRREFLKGVALAGVAASNAKAFANFRGGGQARDIKTGGSMIYRTLGQTGERVSAIGMGGFHIGQPKLSEEESIKLVRAAIDGGINFMDNSWDYNEGQSEIRMGKALKDGYRQKVFLMTKLDGRTKEEAAKQIDESLQRLQTDHLDLIQHHEVIRFEDPDRIFAEGGAQEAVLEAKKAGKVRYIGFTGHKDPHIHLYMLEVAAEHGFHFDTVQMPLNVMDAHFRSFAKLVLPKLVEQKIGVLGMKSMGDQIILKSGAVKRDGVPALRAEPADLSRDYRNRQPGDSGTGVGGGKNFQGDEQGAGCGPAGKDREAGGTRRIRAIQNLSSFRFHRAPSGVAGQAVAQS